MLNEKAETKRKGDIRSKYVEFVLNCRPEERNNGKIKLQQENCFQDFINSVPVTERLPHWSFSVSNDVEAMKIAQVFDALETYAFNLWDFPWKKDFWRISTYSGFYKLCLEPYIGEPDRLLRVLGYKRTPDHELRVVERLPNKQTISRAAFDFFMCATEYRSKESVAPNVAVDINVYRKFFAEVLNSVDDNQSAEKNDEDKPENRRDINVERGCTPFEIGSIRGRQLSKSYGSQTQTRAAMKNGIAMTVGTFGESGNNLEASDTRMRTKTTNLLAPSTQACRQHQQHQHRRCLGDLGQTASWSSTLDFQRKSDVASSRADAFRSSEVDRLAAVLMDVDPQRLADAETRRSIKSRLEQYGSRLKNAGWGSAPSVDRVSVTSDPQFNESLILGDDREARFCFDVPRANESDGWTCYACRNYNKKEFRLCWNCNSLPLL